jgi:hypothetical protein
VSSLNSLLGQIKNPNSRVFRRLEIKRRNTGTGLYEDNWQDITDDVVKWGSVKKDIESNRVGQYKFSNISLQMTNEIGRYNPYSDENSLWYGYGDQQRTLVRISAGFLYLSEGANGIWTRTEYPSDDTKILFMGFISGDVNVVGTNIVNIPVVPLTQCFRQFAASRLTFYNNSLTASDFVTGLRDQQDTNSNYIFRPFFGNTTTNWDISTTTNEYGNLSTSTAEDLTNLTAWDVVQKLSEAENFIPFVTSEGVFKFVDRSLDTTSSFEFYGPGGFSNVYGRTIKKVTWYGKRFSKYYSRVSVKYREADTTTSYEVEDSQYLVSGDSGPWTLGEKTLSIDNTWIPTATTAALIATDLFDEYSALPFEVEFTTSFVPHVDVFDSVLITYDQSPIQGHAQWDLYNWGDTATGTDYPDDLYWDASAGDALKLYQAEFKIISVDIDLDSFECKYTGRQ